MRYLVQCLLAMAYIASAHAAGLSMENPAPGIYVHHGVHEDLAEGYHGDIANIGFVVGKDSVAVIDTGGSLAVGQALKAEIRKVTALPIRYVINTHVHPDHIFGNAAFTDDHPQFIGHKKLGDAMERHREIYMRNNAQWLGSSFDGSEIVKPNTPVDDTLQIDLGGRLLTLHAYATSHSSSDLTVFDPQTGTLWTGDLLFIERTPSIDGDIKGWLATIDQLKNVPAKRVIPGHGPTSNQPAAALADEQRYLATLLNDVRSSIKNGGTMEKAMDTAAASEKGKWALFDIVNRRNVNIIYPVLEWE